MLHECSETCMVASVGAKYILKCMENLVNRSHTYRQIGEVLQALRFSTKTNLHLLRVELRCKLPGKLHRVTGPLAHDVVLNRTFA